MSDFIRERWLSIRATPKHFQVKPLKALGENRYEASEHTVYERIYRNTPQGIKQCELRRMGDRVLIS